MTPAPVLAGRIFAAGLILFGTGIASAIAQPAVPGGNLDISLLTVGPGTVYFERFGHNAIVVHDRDSGRSIAYNYGIFDFDEDDFLLNFARGRMRYRIAADPLADDLAFYVGEGRRIRLQHLAFTPAERDALRAYLEWNARPENAYYRYDYFTANCSTRVRDALDRALGGAIRRQSENRAVAATFRSDTLRLMAAEPWLMLGIDLGLGPFADRHLDLWQESFVPAIFASAIDTVQAPDAAGTQRALVTDAHLISAGTVAMPPAQPPDLRWPFLILGIALGLLLLALAGARGRRSARVGFAAIALVLSLFCGIGGLILLALWGLTDHVAAWRNENLLLLDPLYLILVPTFLAAFRTSWRPSAWARASASAIAAVALFALVSKALPWFVQANLHWIALFLPIHLALATIVMRRPAPAARDRLPGP
ncbi:MAG TPA: DUF4105 domain-containing protein [Rhodanobacteraceae bacterium]|nr:DUF4105 domain-containing protein [Rhodanobacteraceae bacterium]